jgi:hypothetical protein
MALAEATTIYNITPVTTKFSFHENENLPVDTIIGQFNVQADGIITTLMLVSQNITVLWGDGDSTTLNDISWFEVQNNSSTLSVIIIKIPNSVIYTKFYTKPINYNVVFNVVFNLRTTESLDIASQAIINNAKFLSLVPSLIPINSNSIVVKDTIIVSFQIDNKYANNVEDMSCRIDWGDNSEITLGRIQYIRNNPLVTTIPFTYQVLNNNDHQYPILNTNESYQIQVTLTNSAGGIMTLFNKIDVLATIIINIEYIEPEPIEFTGIESVPLKVGIVVGQFRIKSNIPLSVNNFFNNGGTILIDWGDSNIIPVNFFTNNLFQNNDVFIIKISNNNGHTYIDDGNYNVKITVKYGNIETIIASYCVIQDAILIPQLPLVINLITYTLGKGIKIASFKDNISSVITPTQFSALIDWGDGSPINLGSIRQVQNTSTYEIYTNNPHTYSQNGSFKLQIVIEDVDNSMCICYATVNVNAILPPNQPITGINIIVPNLIVCKNDKFKFTATFTDLSNSLAPYTVMIIWGDGHPPENVTFTQINTSSQFLINVKHKYKKCGIYTVTVLVNNVPAIGQITVIDCEDCDSDD